MKITPTAIPDVLVIEPVVFSDARGFFLETWNRRKFAEAGLDADFVQDNHSCSHKNTLRGLHYQLQNTQGKLVRVNLGTVYDVAVDIRRSSSTFGKWVGEVVSAENRKLFWVPPGFAHGFMVLSDVAEFQYKCTDYYNPAAERCIAFDDPDLAIAWPVKDPTQLILSEKDRNGKAFREAELFD
ncbi:MAG: dTDP-4-dehydrorhamnose 3,5-epimerase [Candidatus Rifleibacterium amylolyticum]|nr:MAG: dTDP-4-dehydrorhamnose 3,5-epimerase [Candidatus Rifleibacterium amylolyticum]